MNQLSPFISNLKDSFESIIVPLEPYANEEVISLDTIDVVLRSLLNINDMREAGSFFTGQKLATKLVSKLTQKITTDSIVIDPTCGAGNLLIECSRRLEVV